MKERDLFLGWGVDFERQIKSHSWILIAAAARVTWAAFV